MFYYTIITVILLLLLLFKTHKVIFCRGEDAENIEIREGPFSMDYGERGSHARGRPHTQDTSRMGTARVKQEEVVDTRIIVKEEEADTRIISK